MRMLPLRRSLITISTGAVLCLSALGSAEAAPISYDINYDPADVLLKNNGVACTGTVASNTASGTTCQSLQFVFDLGNTALGFNAATDTLASGSVTFTFYDDNTPGPDASGTHTETVDISLDGILIADDFNVGNGFTSLSPNTTSPFNVLANLSDGQLTVLLALAPVNGNNDFYFASSRLIARGERADTPPPTSSSPEPASVLLFGTAAVGLAVRRRRSIR